jgi:hypothetical protein
VVLPLPPRPRRSYQHFCRCGRTLDARLEALGGKRLAARADINREDFAAIDGWVESVCSALATLPLKTLAELGGTAALAAPAAEGGAAPAKRWVCGADVLACHHHLHSPAEEQYAVHTQACCGGLCVRGSHLPVALQFHQPQT